MRMPPPEVLRGLLAGLVILIIGLTSILIVEARSDQVPRPSNTEAPLTGPTGTESPSASPAPTDLPPGAPVTPTARSSGARQASGPSPTPTEPVTGISPSPRPKRSPSPTEPVTGISPSPRLSTSKSSAVPAVVFYANCAAVNAVHPEGIFKDDPGYTLDLDGDGDGHACGPE